MADRDGFNGEFDAVVGGAQQSAPWALDRIFTTLSPVVAGYLRMQGCKEPEDVTSEVFVAVLRNIRSFTGDERGFRSWVFTIAHRRLLDERRRLSRRPHHASLGHEQEPAAPESVEDDVTRSESDEWVRSLCHRLVPDQRDVLLLRLFGGLTIDEVAAALGKTSGATKALQRRGMRAVGRLLEREGVPL
ncbi:MAG TPA: sigma-70 family RNA polymerase sigma factor [Acidimicrobiales bacterium]|jgi:RNA polymerase sigma-70 factor (ECF subfamily)